MPTRAGLYVHFPFCLSVCPYCDFVVYAGNVARGPASTIDRLVEALVREISLRGCRSPLRSVYLGGGTPSLLSVTHVARLLDAAARSFGLDAGAEVTLEVNPGPRERGDLAGFRAVGVNRLSIGGQSFDEHELRRLGRRHSPADIGATVAAARAAGFDNVSLDLLYDVPGQTPESWLASVTAAIDLGVEHVSAYALVLDDPDAEGLTGARGDHLPLRDGARRWRTRARRQQDADRAATMYEAADDALAGAGLRWYEISNWARPGRHSRHNMAYWQGAAWEAVGPGAHRFDGRRTRAWNAARMAGYLTALEAGSLPPGGSETADESTAAAELAMLRLRTADGLAVAQATREAQPALAWARRNELVEEVGEVVRLSRRGRLLADELFVRLMPDGNIATAA
jgi:putative oxygen-independent coproporphyrinogen III oxidase